jgi:hypothetical protein
LVLWVSLYLTKSQHHSSMPGTSNKNIFERWLPSSQPPKANAEPHRHKLRSNHPPTTDHGPTAGGEGRHHSSGRGYHSDANTVHTPSFQNTQGSSNSRSSNHKHPSKQAASSGHSQPPRPSPPMTQPPFVPNLAHSHRSRQDTSFDPRIHTQNYASFDSTSYSPHEQATVGSIKPARFGSSQNGYNMASSTSIPTLITPPFMSNVIEQLTRYGSPLKRRQLQNAIDTTIKAQTEKIPTMEEKNAIGFGREV